MASNESSNTSSPSLTRLTSIESTPVLTSDAVAFHEHPLRSFRILSNEYILDCERTKKSLTKIFDQADRRYIHYCLKHVQSGHSQDAFALFQRRLDALFVWYNLYYELSISIRKLSGLLRCHGCDDWPKLCVRSTGTRYKRMGEQESEGGPNDSPIDESSPDRADQTTDESDAEESDNSGDESADEDEDDLHEVSPRVA